MDEDDNGKFKLESIVSLYHYCHSTGRDKLKNMMNVHLTELSRCFLFCQSYHMTCDKALIGWRQCGIIYFCQKASQPTCGLAKSNKTAGYSR